MAPSHHPYHRSRAAASALRVVATLVALLLTLSSLGQVAHFLLVPHAICAEHGELLELSERDAHVGAGDAEGSKEARVSTVPTSAEHDHCQVLARGQRELALPVPPALDIVRSTGAETTLVVARQDAIFRALSPLSLAPKTSPPALAVV